MNNTDSTALNQRWMRTASAGVLEQSIPDNIEKYRNGTFSIPESDTLEMVNIAPVSSDIASKMEGESSKSDIKDAITLYEALPGLTFQMAAEKRLWIYLGHTIFLDYIRKRFPIPEDKDKAISHIKRRWFCEGNLMRNALYGLWWSVALTVDDTPNIDDKYHLTRVLFSNYSIRTTWITVILRIPNVLRGILMFIKKHKEELPGIELPVRYLSSYFNRLGANILLTTLSINDVMALCEKQYEIIKNLRSRKDLYEAYKSLGRNWEDIESEENIEDDTFF